MDAKGGEAFLWSCAGVCEVSAEYDIPVMIDRLRRADIPLDHLCYELNEEEWRRFTEYLKLSTRYRDADLSYIEDCSYMGMRIRKRESIAKPTRREYK